MARRYEQAVHRGENTNDQLTYKVSLVIKEMQNKTTMRYYLISFDTFFYIWHTFKGLTMPSTGECME